MKSSNEVSLHGVIDIHVHTAPDTRPRWHSAEEFAQHADAAGMAGFVLKHHDRSTVGDALQARACKPHLQIFGGLALNRSAGGLDSARVASVLDQGGRIIWLPTKDGAGERAAQGRNDGLALLDRDGKITAEVRRILEQIAQADAVLATGHAGAEEITALLPAARQFGVRRMVINHPEIPFLQFNTELQKRWRDEGALLERCYPRPEASNGFDQIAREAREVGIDSTILATDLGRRDLPDPIEGMRTMTYELATRGFTEDELAVMTQRNPWRLLSPHPPH